MKVFLLAGSLIANAVLALALAWPHSPVPATIRRILASPSTHAAPPAPGPVATSAVASAPARTPLWQRLETADLKTLRDRLLAAGFPPLVVREMIIARISADFARRTARFTETDPNVPFWKLAPTNVYSLSDKRIQEYMAAQRDRSQVMRDLLGDPMFSTEGVTADQQRRYGNLSRAKIDALERIEADYRDMMMGVQGATRGVRLPEDDEKLALLDREKKADLAAMLTPEELADYETRNSPITLFIRSRLAGFDASEAEFKTLYAGFKEFSDKYSAAGGTVDFQTRQEWTEALGQKLQAAWGEARYADFVRDTTDEFQQLSAIARRENVTREAAVQAFGVRDAAVKESMRIYNDGAMTVDQKREALQALAQDSRKKIETTLGSAAPAYLRVANAWLRPLEQGGAVEFSPFVPLVLSRPGGMSVLSPSQTPRIRMLPKG